MFTDEMVRLIQEEYRDPEKERTKHHDTTVVFLFKLMAFSCFLNLVYWAGVITRRVLCS